MKKVYRILTMVLVLSLFIVGCGGGEQAGEKKQEAVMIVEIPKGDPFYRFGVFRTRTTGEKIKVSM